MGKLNIFEISLTDNNADVYYAGQILNGHVTVELNAPMKMRGVYLEVKGKAYVHWSERHTTGSGKNRRTTTRHYSASEHYFQHTLALYGKADPSMSGDNPELPAGRHVFPFQYQLPMNLPSSYEGAHGYVRYSIKSNIDKPWKFDHTTKRMFTVICLLDLNQDQTALAPCSNSGSKTLCCLCCESPPITAQVSLDRSGYVPGEYITVNAEIHNGSNTQMDKSAIRLMMYTTFHATTKSRTGSSEVMRVQKEPIAPHDTFYWVNERVQVPPVPPSYLIHCNIIDIRYVLELEVDPSGMSFDLEVPLNLIIGTIPIRSYIPQHVWSQPMAPMANLTDITPVDPSAPPPQAMAAATPPPDMPPPSYNACVFGTVDTKEDDDNDHTMGQTQYTPNYPYYNWDQHAPFADPDPTKKS